MSQNTIFQTRYAKLNAEQKKAVDTIDGPVLVVAGPGSGKTEILSLRVANILQQTDTLPGSILCLTFTESAAANMRRRLIEFIGPDAYKVSIHTFHSFGSEIIAQNPQYFYNGASYTAADQLVQIEIMEEILSDLSHKDPLNSYHPVQGYTYLRDILSRISELKQSGFSPDAFENHLRENEVFLKTAQPIIAAVFEEKISKKTFNKFHEALVELRALGVSNHLIDSFAFALEEAENDASTKPLTAWKNEYTKKDNRKETILKDYDKMSRLFSLANIYREYQKKLSEKGYYDFADMLLDTVKILQNFPELRYTLQEKYLYVLVDEFQDTNGVQMTLLDQILDADVNEGRPNILAVGDDDQAIFKFQGANIQNILGFHKKYREPELIVLDKNYRSSQKILDFVRPIILQGEERLESILPEITKELKAAKESHEETTITEKVFTEKIQELVWIAQEVQNTNKPLNEIAVIGRKHKDLEDLAKVLDYFNIPVNYERRKNLLEQPHLKEIIKILEFITDTTQDHHLAEILSFPFWGMERLTVWDLSMKAYKGKKLWLEVMLETLEFSPLAKFFINLEAEAKEKTAEEIIDFITGSKELDGYQSPYREHYFSSQDKNYLEFLESLKAFILAIRKHKTAEILNVKDLLQFVKLHQKHNLPLNYTTEYTQQEPAVNLCTAHHSKGLEFDTVFLLHCQESSWIGGGNFNKLNFSSDLPISPETDSIEDKLRLFYVALTRAKHHLYLTHHIQGGRTKEEMRLRFLGQKSEEIPPTSIQTPTPLLAMELSLSSHTPPTPNEQSMLKKLVQNYKLSVTHLNNFLDLIHHGPQKFLENNLLKFPQMISPSAAYGAAIHNALHALQTDLKQKRTLANLDFFISQFEQSLAAYRLNRKDTAKLFEKGRDQLTEYYEQRKSEFHYDDISEFDFKYQNVVIDGAEITGKIDKIRPNSITKEITVYDYKTGKPIQSWDSGDDYKLKKAWTYKNQLLFYKLLIENSRSFQHDNQVRHGILEFVEPVDQRIQTLELQIDPNDVDMLRKLIVVVYNKIVNLDFPDTSNYPQTFTGIQFFISDLLEGKI